MRKALNKPFKMKEAYDAAVTEEELPVGFGEKDEAGGAATQGPSTGVKPLLPQDGKRQGGASVMKRLKGKIDAAGEDPAGELYKQFFASKGMAM